MTGYISGTYVRTGTIAPGASAYQNYLTFLGFPAAYQSYLVSLHAKYPSWIFIANNTGESWSTAIANEVNRPTYPGMSLIHPQMISSWKKSSEGYYDYETSTYAKYDGNWNAASDELVAYFLDPRNFLNETEHLRCRCLIEAALRLYDTDSLEHICNADSVDVSSTKGSIPACSNERLCSKVVNLVSL